MTNANPYPTNPNLDLNPRLDSFRLDGEEIVLGESESGGPLLETYQLVNGYNTEITYEPFEADGGRKGNRITLSAVPGSGRGRYPVCEDSPTIKSINGIRPNANGDFYLSATDCFWLGIPSQLIQGGSQLVPNTLQLHNDCQPCCQCDDYVRVYKALKNVHNSYRDIGYEAERVRDNYGKLVNRWENSRLCRSLGPLRLVVTPLTGGQFDIQGAYCVPAKGCRGELTMTFTMTHNLSKTGEIAEDSTWIRLPGEPQPQRYTMDGDWPEFVAFWDRTESGKAARIRFRLLLDDPLDGDTLAVSLTAEHEDLGSWTVDGQWSVIPS